MFKKKLNASSQVDKSKAPMVVKGYSQVEGVNIGDIFSLIVKLTSIRLLSSLDTAFDLEIKQMGGNTAFLHGDLLIGKIYPYQVVWDYTQRKRPNNTLPCLE